MAKYNESGSVCGNCGAMLSDGIDKCPYCGSDNVENLKNIKINFEKADKYVSENKLSRAYIYGRRRSGVNTEKEEEEFNSNNKIKHNQNSIFASENNKLFAILSVIFGSLSVLSVIFNGFSFILAIAGGVLGIISFVKNEQGGEIMAIIGIALSGFAIVGCILRWVSYFILWIF